MKQRAQRTWFHVETCLLYTSYSRQFTQPIAQTAGIANIIQSTIASAERVFEILDEDEEIPDPVDAEEIEFPAGKVEFQGVRFGYEEGNTLIENMSISAKPGQAIACLLYTSHRYADQRGFRFMFLYLLSHDVAYFFRTHRSFKWIWNQDNLSHKSTFFRGDQALSLIHI